ncbi:MAG TPA: methionyl-tRNA formyltransferase [Candidatus Limnocylindrales bacterium]|nr:methionyl-tRNA formyltransferase [Candidatus Limnocylindrales bacterium]
MARIVLFGQAQFGQRVFEEVLARGHEVTAVCVPPDAPGRPADPLKAAAAERSVRVVQRRSYRDDGAAAEVAADAADLGVLAYVTQIIPRTILDAPRLASICFHPSLLPAYRGGSAINWQLINGERIGGVTLFRPDDGIDEGPIYLQRQIEIGPDDSAGSYYYGRVFEAGITATLDCIELVLSGKAEPRVQDEAQATYEPLCRDEHAGVDWSLPAQRLHDLIRGCDPSPGAHCRFGDAQVRLYGSRIASAGGTVAAPGTVVALDDKGVTVAAGEGSVLVQKLGVAGRKLAAGEGAAALGLAAGARLDGAPGLPAAKARLI